MQSWPQILEAADPKGHVLQLYGDDDQLLIRHVASYVVSGLRLGAGVLMVATAEHTRGVLRRLRDHGVDAPAALGKGRLRIRDAGATLDSFLVDGRPDQDRFDAVIEPEVAEARNCSVSGRVRVFGEMVGLLWMKGEHAGAMVLEEYWNRLLTREKVNLFCAYPVNALEGGLEPADLYGLMTAHTHTCAGPRTLFSNAV